MVQYYPGMDSGFSALAAGTRRGILEHLGRGEAASVSDLAFAFGMTLTGMKKHVQVLENAGLITTQKLGRVRSCTLGPRRLDVEAAWIQGYRQMLEGRLDSLGEFLERTKGEST
ncbi:MAG TPA: metalloregulator ArsR/SmtB family transcription factor [Polyangiaceae bacterium]